MINWNLIKYYKKQITFTPNIFEVHMFDGSVEKYTIYLRIRSKTIPDLILVNILYALYTDFMKISLKLNSIEKKNKVEYTYLPT